MHAKQPDATLTIHCLECKQSNASDRQFCSICGKALWCECPNCKAPTPVSEKFCGGCGSNLEDYFQQRYQQILNRFDEVDALINEMQFEEGQRLLKALLKEDKNRYADLIERAEAKYETIASTREREVERAARASATAKELFVKRKYRGVVEALEGVHDNLLGNETRDILQKSQRNSIRIKELETNAKRFLKEKRPDLLIAELDLLRELVPHDGAVVKLAKRAREQLCRIATNCLQGGNYDQAAKAINSIREFVASDESRELAAKVNSVDWMYRNLRESPFADQVLYSSCQRLIEMVPSDKRTQKIAQQMKTRLVANAKEKRLEFVPWVSPPKRAAIEPRVTPFSALNCVLDPEEQLAAHLGNTGRFAVAIGLAIQGLGMGRISEDFFSGKKKGVMSALLKGRRGNLKEAWGIDIGGSAIKAIKLGWDSARNNLVVKKALIIDVARVEDSRYDSARWQEISASVQKLADVVKTGETVTVSVPTVQVLPRWFSLPDVPEKQLDQLIMFEAQHQIPFAIDEVVYGAHLFDKKRERQGDVPILLVAAKSNFIDVYEKVLKDAGLPNFSLQAETVALYNLMSYLVSQNLAKISETAMEPGCDWTTQTVCFLDMGSETTNVVLANGHQFWSRSISVGGDHFLRPLIRSFGMTHDQAEVAKSKPFSVPDISKLFGQWANEFHSFFQEFDRTLGVAKRELGVQDVSAIHVMGGGSRVHGLYRGSYFGTDSMEIG